MWTPGPPNRIQVKNVLEFGAIGGASASVPCWGLRRTAENTIVAPESTTNYNSTVLRYIRHHREYLLASLSCAHESCRTCGERI